MSMEHKAFIFDDQVFERELAPIICTSGRENDPRPLKTFIANNIGRVLSPYTGELLDNDWENELENGDIQELADFAMTLYYSPEDDHGLGYAWDTVLEALQRLPSELDFNYCILGRPLKDGSFILDPGRMGTGFVKAEHILFYYKELVTLRGEFIKGGVPSYENTLYNITLSDLIAAYDELTLLYKDAVNVNCGLLMTF